MDFRSDVLNGHIVLFTKIFEFIEPNGHLYPYQCSLLIPTLFPLPVIYLSCTMSLIGVSILWTVFILNIHYHVKDTPIPRWAERFLLGRRKHMCCPLEQKATDETTLLCKQGFPKLEGNLEYPQREEIQGFPQKEGIPPNGFMRRKPPGAPQPESQDYYITHQTDLDVAIPGNPATEADTVVRIKGRETLTEHAREHAREDTCNLSNLIGEETGQSVYVPAATNNAEDWKTLARKLDKIMFCIIFSLMFLSAVFILTLPFYHRVSPASDPH